MSYAKAYALCAGGVFLYVHAEQAHHGALNVVLLSCSFGGLYVEWSQGIEYANGRVQDDEAVVGKHNFCGQCEVVLDHVQFCLARLSREREVDDLAILLSHR